MISPNTLPRTSDMQIAAMTGAAIDAIADYPVLPKPGIHFDIDFCKYLAWPFMSQSVLKQGRKSMRHLKCAIDGMRKMKITDMMTLGSGLHTCFLEPAKQDDRVVKWTGDRRAGKEWEAFKALHDGKAILTSGMYDKACGMIESLRADKDIQEWTDRVQAVEVSGIAEIDGVLFKGRTDALTDDPLWDLKAISSTDDRTIDQTIWNFGLHIQGYVYTKIFNRARFRLGFVEYNPPYDVRPVELSAKWLSIGQKETTALLQRHKWCVDHKSWPGCSEKLSVVDPPDWVMQKFSSAGEITFGGEPVFEED